MKTLRRTTCAVLLLALGACASSGSDAENNTSSIIIDDEGGSLSLAGVTVVVPADAVDEPTQLSISITGNPPAALPTDRTFAGPVFMLTPHGQHFSKPVSVTFPRQEGSNELWSLEGPDDDLWFLEAHVTLEEEQATLMTTHFSYFAWLIVNGSDGGDADADARETEDAGVDATIGDGGR